MGDTGYERNTAVFIFEVTITLTEAGLHAAPGVQALLYMHVRVRLSVCLVTSLLAAQTQAGRPQRKQLEAHVAPQLC